MPDDQILDPSDRLDLHGRLVRVETKVDGVTVTLHDQNDALRIIGGKLDGVTTYIAERRGASRKFDHAGAVFLTLGGALVGGLASTVAAWLHLKP